LTDRQLLELLVQKVTSIDGRFDTLESKFDTLESKFGTLESKFGTLESKFDNLESKVDNNHNMVMAELNTLEKNQGAIMRYMQNADTTFRKSEETYEFVQKIKTLFSGN